MKTQIVAMSAVLVGLSQVTIVNAETTLGAGVWANYRYVQDDKRDEKTLGDFADEALILYADGKAPEGEGAWSFSAEMRFGPGSFTRPASNSSGDNLTLHKAWIGWAISPETVLRFGKSQVPFGWKTVNFWPGDILQAGYGDQMDVGVKLSSDAQNVRYDIAYFHADDWGETSTDTADDNGHWGSPTTYRKVQTFVGNASWELSPGQSINLSAQSGRLQDLTGIDEVDLVHGKHSAYTLWYHGEFGPAYVKASYMTMTRELPDNVINAGQLADKIKNDRAFAELGYRVGNWFLYLDASIATPKTQGNTASDVTAFAPGLSYDYGPGWLYLEYLTQDGFVDSNGQVNEGDFDALYLSADFYL